MLPGFWCFGDSLGAPGVTLLEAGGHVWADRKRDRKKERDRERKAAPQETELGTARGRRESKRGLANAQGLALVE